MNHLILSFDSISATISGGLRKAVYRAALFIEKAGLVFLLLFFGFTARAQDYSITTSGGALIVTDLSGNGETIAISESNPYIRFVVASRTYSINGGAITLFSTTPADVDISSLSSITINAAGGNDVITVAAFTANLPSLTINGGTGDETITFNGDINFSADENLDLDLQNDGGSPGTDVVVIANTVNLKLFGTGEATVKVSKYIEIKAGSSIETEDGNLTAEANLQASPSAGDFDGVFVDGANSKLASSGAGVVTVKGKSGNSNTSFGVAVRNGGKIMGNTGDVTVVGTGGLSGAALNYGVWVTGTNSAISSTAGNVSVTGTGGGSGAGSNTNIGVTVESGAKISSGGSVTVAGNGGSTSGGINLGVRVTGAGSSITSSGGDVSVTGTEGGGANSFGLVTASSGSITASGGNITINAKSMDLTAAISATGGGGVTLRSSDNVLINLGTSANTIGGPLGLTSTELALVTGSSVVIGHASAGDITVSAAITHTTSDISLLTGGDILISGGTFSSGTGALLLDCGPSPKAIKPTLNGVDVTASTLSFGSDLAIVVNGTTVDVQYTQLNVAGTVDLTGVDLALSGSHTPVAGQTFTIVNNDGTDAIVGTFNGLAQGATIANFLGSPTLNATISYIGGTGNDVVLTVVAALPVELLAFSAHEKGENVVLAWRTASENNNRGFEIQRSGDGTDWQNIGFEKGNGTTTDRHNYSFLDQKPLRGESFYRLRQLDFDGKEDFSNIVSMDRKRTDGGFSIFPNPTDGLVQFEGIDAEKVQIFDRLGRLVRQIDVPAGRLNLADLPSGMYFLKLTEGVKTVSARVAKE